MLSCDGDEAVVPIDVADDQTSDLGHPRREKRGEEDEVAIRHVNTTARVREALRLAESRDLAREIGCGRPCPSSCECSRGVRADDLVSYCFVEHSCEG